MKKSRLYPRLFVWFLILLFLLVYLYLGKIFVAYGPSMEPTLYNGERLLVDRSAYNVAKPLLNDVAALINPLDGRFNVKRVVALEGDEVEISQEGLRINGELLPRTEGQWQDKKYILQADEVYVLGDNRYNSSDSRDFGPIKISKILGEVKAVIWPPGSWRIVR